MPAFPDPQRSGIKSNTGPAFAMAIGLPLAPGTIRGAGAGPEHPPEAQEIPDSGFDKKPSIWKRSVAMVKSP
jgi:hypothetical protein